MKNLLKDLYNHKIMSKDESKAALISLTDGSANSSQISSFLTVFLMRDITSEELDGFREAMIELSLDVDIDDYMDIEVLPHVPDAWINTSKSGLDKVTGEVGKVGYEINFNRYFYVYTPPRPLEEIEGEILQLQKEINNLMGQLFD